MSVYSQCRKIYHQKTQQPRITLLICAVGSHSLPHNSRLLMQVPKALQSLAPGCHQPHFSAISLYPSPNWIFIFPSQIQTGLPIWGLPNAPDPMFSHALALCLYYWLYLQEAPSTSCLYCGILKVQLKCHIFSKGFLPLLLSLSLLQII